MPLRCPPQVPCSYSTLYLPQLALSLFLTRLQAPTWKGLFSSHCLCAYHIAWHRILPKLCLLDLKCLSDGQTRQPRQNTETCHYSVLSFIHSFKKQVLLTYNEEDINPCPWEAQLYDNLGLKIKNPLAKLSEFISSSKLIT